MSAIGRAVFSDTARAGDRVVVTFGSEYWTGPRITRYGYAAEVRWNDGRPTAHCGHHTHRTIKTAAKCGAKLRQRLRMPTEATP